MCLSCLYLLLRLTDNCARLCSFFLSILHGVPSLGFPLETFQERKTQLAKAAWMGEQVGVDAAAEAAAAGNSRRLLQQQGGQMGVRADDIRQLMGLV